MTLTLLFSQVLRGSGPDDSDIQQGHRHIVRCGKAPGILKPDEAAACRCIELGSLFTAVGLDLVLLACESEKLARRFKA